MKKLYCEKCEGFTKSSYEIALFEAGELDNRCPVCGTIGSVILIEEETNNINDNTKE